MKTNWLVTSILMLATLILGIIGGYSYGQSHRGNPAAKSTTTPLCAEPNESYGYSVNEAKDLTVYCIQPDGTKYTYTVPYPGDEAVTEPAQ